jgi:hypothetical protein
MLSLRVGMGFGELAFLLILGFVIFRPGKLPRLLRTVGRSAGTVRTSWVRSQRRRAERILAERRASPVGPLLASGLAILCAVALCWAAVAWNTPAHGK